MYEELSAFWKLRLIVRIDGQTRPMISSRIGSPRKKTSSRTAANPTRAVIIWPSFGVVSEMVSPRAAWTPELTAWVTARVDTDTGPPQRRPGSFVGSIVVSAGVRGQWIADPGARGSGRPGRVDRLEDGRGVL